MYCKDCGKSIADDSRFCSHCGALQVKPQNLANPKQIQLQPWIDKLENLLGISISNKVIGYYLIWVLVHLTLLIVNWDASRRANNLFWPFSADSELKHYNVSEFLIYTIIPLIVIGIVNLLKTPKEDLQLKYDMSYKMDPGPTVVGICILIVSVFLLIDGQVKDFYGNYKYGLNEYETGMTVFLLFFRVLISIWVVNIAKELNREKIGWGLFAFFLPAISLIVIGQMRKLKDPDAE